MEWKGTEGMKEKYSLYHFVCNPEIRRQLFLYFGAGAGIGTIGFLFFAKAAAFVVFVWAAAGLFHFAEAWVRYRNIAMLSGEIDRILHREDILTLPDMREGELSILEDEVNKLLIRLKEQNKELRREKCYLADSLADLSHQLRTPLTSVNLIFSMLEEEDLTPLERQEYFRKQQRLLRKVQWLIDVLLKISKLDADAVVFETRPVTMQELIKEAVSPLEVLMELKGQTLHADGGEAGFSVDLRWTAEAVENILKNCMEHSAPGGVITVSGTENAVYSELVISDCGTGIDKEDLPHLFERFYKGKNSSEESAGIGLALAKSIITKQGGVIRAENKREGGAGFLIRFYKTDL